MAATPDFSAFDKALGLDPEGDNEFVDPEYPIAEPKKPEQPEAPAGPDFSAFDRALGLEQPEPEPEMAPPEEMGTVANLWAGLRERGAGLVGDLAGGLQTYGEALEGEYGNLGGFVHKGGLDWDYFSPEEWAAYQEDGGQMLLRDIQDDWKNTSYGFTPNAGENWEILKSNPNIWEKAQAAAAFALETGVISLADMAGAVVAPAPYIMARAEEIAQERAVQAGRPGQPNNDDLKIALGTATLIQAMERFGFDRIMDAWTKGGPALQRILGAGVGEGATEALQEPLEFLAETYGTQTEEGMTSEEYQMAALERAGQGALGGGPVGATLAAPPILLEKAGLKEPTISPDVKSTDENRYAITRALNEQAIKMEQDQVIQDERDMLESEQQAAEMAIQREADEIDAQEATYRSAAHAEVKLQQLEKKYGETRLFPTQNAEGEWILTSYGMASARDTMRERDERLGVGLRPAEEGTIEVDYSGSPKPAGTPFDVSVTHGEEIIATEPAPTTEGIEVGEEITATEPAPTTEGIEVTEEPPFGGDLIPEPTARRIPVTEETAEEVIATEPAPTTEGIEVEEVTPEEVGEAIPQIGVEEVTEGEETIDLKGGKIYQRKPPPDDEEPPPGGAGAPVEPGGGPGPIMPSIASGAISKGRKARKGIDKELTDVEAKLETYPKDVDITLPDSDKTLDQIHKLRIQRRDLMDERDHRITPEEAKQARSELWERMRDEGESINRYESITEMRARLGKKKVDAMAESAYNRVVDLIAKAEEEGQTPTVEYIQTQLGFNARAAKRYLDRYNEEVSGEPDTTPLVSPETPVEQTQEFSAEEIADIKKAAFGTKKQMARVREKYGIDNEEIGRRFEAINAMEQAAAEEVQTAPVTEHPKVPGRMDTDTLPDGTEYDLSKTAETQIATTVGTYDKVKERYFSDIDNGEILDYGAGKGLASQKHGFESLEPYPRGWTPTYQNTYQIKRQYSGIILNNILNVLPKHTRRAVLWDAAEKLRPGAQMYINVRSRGDVMKTAVIAKQFNDSEIITGRGTYQKGFQQQELMNFIQAELGPDYTVEAAFHGSVSVTVTKSGKPPIDEGPTPNEEAAAAAAEQEVEGREAVDEEAQVAAFNFVDSNPAFVGLKNSHKPGDVRYGKTLPHYYGDQDRTEGADGDPVDVVLNKNFEIGKEYPIFIVNLIDPKTGDFEQHKVAAGFEDIVEAEEGVEDMYPGQVDDVTMVQPDEYTIWRNSIRTRQPFDRDKFRADLNKSKDLAKPLATDEVLDPVELGTTEADPAGRSPWLLADGSIVDGGEDHMGYVISRGIEADSGHDLRAVSKMQLEGGGVRSAFFYDQVENKNVAYLHLHEDQKLTEAQIKAVETFIKSSKKAGRDAEIQLGATPSYDPEKAPQDFNPQTKKTSMAAMKRDWGERKARYRADMEKFYQGLADKSATYAKAAGLRMTAAMKPNPTKDDLITFLRKHGGLNVNIGGDWRGRLSQLNAKYRLPGLPGIEQTNGSGLTMDQAAEIAWESNYIPQYDADMLADALERAENDMDVYSDQNTEWMQAEWEAEQERVEQEMRDRGEFDAEYLGEIEPSIDSEMAELMAQADQLDRVQAEEIASRDIDDEIVKQQLRDLIDERKAAKQAKGEEADEGTPADAGDATEAAGPEGRAEVPDSVRQPEQAPDVGDYDTVEDYPWQELAQAAGVEILEPPTPDIEGPRMFVIDVYSDVGRTKFVKQVFAANYFRFRDVETAFLARKGPFQARVQDRNEFIEISKLGFVTANEPDNLHRHILESNLKKPYRKLDSIDRIETKEAESKKNRPVQGSGWLTVEQWNSTAGQYIDDLMAEPDPDTVVKHWGEEFKKGDTPRNYISHKEGKAKIAEWEKHAKKVGKMSRKGELATSNSQRVILSLFDATGEWAQPWIDAGYDVRAIDLKRDDMDIMDIDYQWLLDMGFLEGPGIWGILAACPCTEFSEAGRRDWKPEYSPRPSAEGGKDFIGKTHRSVDLVNQTLSLIDFLKPRFWALENPLGRVKKITGVPEPRLSFNPNNYGDPYTKKTQIFGNFNANLPTANVDPREEFGGLGSRAHKLGSKDELDGGLRSVTPPGFAYSFFMANNDVDYPIVQEIADQAKRTLDPKIKEDDPNIERKVELLVTLTLSQDYYGEEYTLDETDSFPAWAKGLIEEMQRDIQEDWRLEDGRVLTNDELTAMDKDLRTLLGVPQKKGVEWPQKPEIDAAPVETLNELEGPYADVVYEIIDPYMLEAAVDAVNIAIEDLAAQGYTYAELRGKSSTYLPDYLGRPMGTITSVASAAIPVAKSLRAVRAGDKRTSPRTAFDRLMNWKQALDEATGQTIVSDADFRDHVREEYPWLAQALDASYSDDDDGMAMRRQVPDRTTVKADLYERMGRDDLAWGPVESAPPLEEEGRTSKPEQPQEALPGEEPAPATEAAEEVAWEPVPERELPPLVDIQEVLDASAEGEGTDLASIPLTATDGDRSVTHNAKWWKAAIDDRLAKLNKIRGCA